MPPFDKNSEPVIISIKVDKWLNCYYEIEFFRHFITKYWPYWDRLT